MSSQVLIVARHELRVTFATRRALAAVALYLVSAVLAGAGYILALRSLERQAAEALAARGVDPTRAAETVSRVGQQSYERFVTFFASTDGAPVAKSLTDSVILPAFLWGSLAFLPFLVVLTSFDSIAGDLQTRSLCYSTLRASRWALLLGKLLAHAVLFVGLSILASAAMIVVATLLLERFDLLATLPGLLRSWSLLLPYGLAYLGLSVFCSASVKQPAVALILALGLMVGLRLLGTFRHLPADHALGGLRIISWLSPARYQSGFWEAGFNGPLSSVVSYLLFGAVFVALAHTRLKARDL